MNCKPGDLAICVHGEVAGGLFEVLHWVGHFRAHDGDACEDGWMLRSLCSYRFWYVDGSYREEGVGRDASLRPLSGNLEDEKRDEEITA